MAIDKPTTVFLNKAPFFLRNRRETPVAFNIAGPYDYSCFDSAFINFYHIYLIRMYAVTASILFVLYWITIIGPLEFHRRSIP